MSPSVQIRLPRDLPAAFDMLNSRTLQNVDYLRAFINKYAAGQKAQFALLDAVTAMVCEIGNYYVDDKGRNFGLLYYLQWRVDFHKVLETDPARNVGVFVTFTGILDVEEHPKFPLWVKDITEDYEEFRDGVAIIRGFWLTPSQQSITSDPVALSEFYRTAHGAIARWKPGYRISPRWAELVLRSFFPFVAENKEQVVPEVNHTRPLTRLELEAFLQEHAAENEYVHLLSFVDDRTTFWSRHLALKTRKPQTMDTPQYVVEKGPNIITVTLERSDLEPGERAPKMQMIFSDVDGKLAITPRIEGTMVTHRMLDTFDQILKEVSAGQSIIFGDLNQIVTFVGQVADQESTVVGFRQELGNPEQALIEAEVPNPVVYFRMTPKDGKEVEIEALGKGDEGEDDTLLKLIILENKGEDGQFVLAMSAKTREASFERGRELAEQMPEAWNEVRSTKPTPDAAVGIGVSADPIPDTPGVNPHALKTPEVIYNPEDNAAQESVRMNVIREHSIGGQDHYLLSHWIGRMLKEGQLSKRDRRALTAFHNHIFADGLVNLDQWSYIAEVTSDHTQENKQWLKGDNNAYVAIYDESPNAQNKKQGAVALIQFHVGALVA